MEFGLLFVLLQCSVAFPAFNNSLYRNYIIRPVRERLPSQLIQRDVSPHSGKAPLKLREVQRESLEKNNQFCAEVLCIDGRCVPESWLCDDESKLKDQVVVAQTGHLRQSQRQIELLFYIISLCGVVLVSVIALGCVCAVEEEFANIRSDIVHPEKKTQNLKKIESPKKVFISSSNKQLQNILSESSITSEDSKADLIQNVKV